MLPLVDHGVPVFLRTRVLLQTQHVDVAASERLFLASEEGGYEPVGAADGLQLVLGDVGLGDVRQPSGGAPH